MEVGLSLELWCVSVCVALMNMVGYLASSIIPSTSPRGRMSWNDRTKVIMPFECPCHSMHCEVGDNYISRSCLRVFTFHLPGPLLMSFCLVS